MLTTVPFADPIPYDPERSYTNARFGIFAICTTVMLIMTGSLYWLSFVSTRHREAGTDAHMSGSFQWEGMSGCS